MDDHNLMEFKSPPTTIILQHSEAVADINLAGNNPFDIVSQCADQINTFVDFLPPDDIEDFFKNSWKYSGRPSLMFMNNIDIDPGKESLGILKLEELNSSFNSSGVVPTINLTACVEQPIDSSENCLNTAFIYSARTHKLSVASNNSCTNPSLFNSGSLEPSGPSNILSLNSFEAFDEFSDIPLNKGFLAGGIKRLTLNDKSNVENPTKLRSHSIGEKVIKDVNVNSKRRCWSISEFDDKTPIKKQLQSEDVEETEDAWFNNSVFIEANFIASKIADGSIFEDEFSIEEIANINPPDFKDIDDNDLDHPKTDTITVFKEIDKMLQFSSKLNLENINGNNKDGNCIDTTDKLVSTQSNTSNASIKSKSANELLQNLSEIINNDGRDPRLKREGQQLLTGLANILCTETVKLENSEDSGHSSIEQEEQQNEELPIYCQVLDLRTTASKSNDNAEALDLSMKSKDICNKKMSQSFSFPSTIRFSINTSNNSSTNCRDPSIKSSTSLDSKTDLSNSELHKLKPKKIELKTNLIRKGPLKAIIPLRNMAKNKSLTNKIQNVNLTPPKLEAKTSVFKTSRTSTPITEPQLKPMAQSTPDAKCPTNVDSKPLSYSQSKKKVYNVMSPMVKPPDIGNFSSDNSNLNKTNHSGSAPNLSNTSDNSKNLRRNSMIPSPKQMYRRHSATDIKTSSNCNTNRLRRSLSIGKDAKPPRLTLPRDNANVLKKLNVSQEKRSETARIKSVGLVGKFRKTVGNKENIIH